MTEHDGAQQDFLGQLACLRFDHQDTLAGAGDDQVELRFRHLFRCRVEHISAVDPAHTGATDRAQERNAREG